MFAKSTETSSSHKTYLFEEFTLDIDRGSLSRSGVDIQLRPKSFEVLRYLVERHGQLVSKEELLGSIWRHSVVTDDAVTQCLIDIRRAIGDRDRQKVRTLPRRGYIFDVPVEVNAGRSAPAAPPNTAATAANHRPRLTSILAIVLVVAGTWWGLDRFGDTPSVAEGTRPSIGSAAIAVLPFADMSAAQDQEYLADGISEEILNLLTRVSELRVIARTSSFSFKGKNSDVNEIAKQLNVTHILEGSVRKSGKRIRVTAQLVDATTSEHLWSETYDRTLDDIFAIQDDVAAIVVGELESRLLDQLPASRRTEPEAYALFLRARSLARAGEGKGDVAESLLRQALEIDPYYAPAWSTLALATYFQTAPNNDTTWIRYSRDEGEQLWKTALETAYKLDPTNGTANVYFGWRRFFNDRDPEGIRMQEFAVATEPNNSEVLRVAGSFARYIGHWDVAIALGQRAIDVDPLCQMCYWNLILTYLYAGRLDAAEDTARTSTTLFDRGWHDLGTVLLLKGDAEKALRAYDKLQAHQFDGWQWRHGRALALHSLGRLEESRDNLAAFIESSEKYIPRLTSAAQIYAWMGDSDGVFETLDSLSHPNPAYRRADFLTGAAWHPIYQNVHDDPRWQAYWELAQTSPEELQAIEFNVKLPQR
jgi:TolB-like protein/DNA-binding winged helix-turn-helix (wHTH) protein